MRRILPFFATLAYAQADNLPQNLNSWHIEGGGIYARIYETLADETARNSVTTWSRGQGTQSLPTYGGINEISYNDNNVYVRSTGLSTHIMGPWYGDEDKTQLFPNYPANQSLLYRIPRDPGDPPSVKIPTGLGRIGLFVNGVAMFDSRDAFSYDTSEGVDERPGSGSEVEGDDVWNRDAYVNENVTFDNAFAHQAGDTYHYHANAPGLRHELGDSVDYDLETNTYTENFNGEHSPILAWVSDGLPLYGPYGYSDPNDSSSPVVRMRSGFRKRTITDRTTLPAYAARVQDFTNAGDSAEYALSEDLHGPSVSEDFPIGHYLEDYEYLGDLINSADNEVFEQGVDFDLNESNVRFCTTPEFPEGTYAYFINIEEDGTPAFPYNIGRTYFGNPSGGTSNTLPNNATIIFEGGPEIESQPEYSLNGDEVTLTWQSAEGGSYLVEESEDLDLWTPATFTKEGNQLEVSSNLPKQFFRRTLEAHDDFDDEGFSISDLPPANLPNNILLIILDDWGVDSSPLDNPSAPSLPSMPTYETLAAQGVRFTNAHAQPSCSPTRATLLTGRFSFRHGIGSPGGATLAASELTLPEVFSAANSPYALGSFGKWHLGGDENGPQTLGGWPHYSGEISGNLLSYTDWSKTTNGSTIENFSTYTTTDNVDETLSFINSQSDKPWFVWLALHSPHSPFEEPPSDLVLSGSSEGGNRGIYERMLEAADTEIKRLTDGIDLSKTNIIIMGDNGTTRSQVQAPYISGRVKGSLYQGGTNVPCIALGPDITATGTIDQTVHVADFFSTILELAGISEETVIPDDHIYDSRSLFGVLNNSGSVTGGIITEDFGGSAIDPGRAIFLNDYKLHRYEDGREEFYHLPSDQLENSNLLLTPLSDEQQDAYDAIIAYELSVDGPSASALTGLLSASPSSGAAGSQITITLEFDPDHDPGTPGLNQTINTITLGNIIGTNYMRSARNTATFEITLPSTPGEYDIEAIFNGAQARVLGQSNVFIVTP